MNPTTNAWVGTISMIIGILFLIIFTAGGEEGLLKWGDRVGEWIENTTGITHAGQSYSSIIINWMAMIFLGFAAAPKKQTALIVTFVFTIVCWTAAWRLKPRQRGILHPWRKPRNGQLLNYIRMSIYIGNICSTPLGILEYKNLSWLWVPLSLSSLTLLTWPLLRWEPKPKTITAAVPQGTQ